MDNQYVETGYVLSAQQRLTWDQTKSSGLGRRSATINIMGNLDGHRLRVAIEQLAQRHPILRGRLTQPEGMIYPLQVEDSHNLLSVEDGQGEDQIRPMGAIRFRLVNDTPHQSRLLIEADAICADAWSLRLLSESLATFYQGGVEEDDDEAPCFYQYAEWSNRLLEEVDPQALAFWANRADYQPMQNLLARPQMRSGKVEMASVPISLPAARATALHKLAEQYETTPALLLLATWSVLLRRHDGREALSLAIDYDGREFEEFYDIVGPLARWMPLRMSLSGEESLPDLLASIETDFNAMLPWHDYIAAHEKPIVNPLDFAFSYHQTMEAIFSGQVTFSMEELQITDDPFRLHLSCVERTPLIEMALYYDARWITQDGVVELGRQFRVLIDHLTSGRETALSSLGSWDAQAITDATQHQGSPEPDSKTVLHLFHQIVHENPDELAVVSGDIRLTFRELNDRTDLLARYLYAHFNLGLNTRAGVMVAPSMNLPIAMLAILKTGAAYVPIDPENPEERIAHILEDSGILVLLHDSQTPAPEGIPAVQIDGPIEENTPEIPTRIRHPLANCYVIYTSGTSGRPKGTMISDQGLVNYATWLRTRFNLSHVDRSLLLSSHAFDLGYTALWGCLLSGATLHLVSEQDRRKPELVLNYLHDEKITFVKLTPSLLNMLLGDPQASSFQYCESLRLILIGGEAMRTKDLETLHHFCPEAQLVNHYGPTEATIGCIAHVINPQHWEDYLARPVIGKPINHMQAFVLDKELRHVFPGVQGELYVAGPGLALGYLHLDDLTRERFIHCPFQPGTLMYRTGDRVRRLLDGTLMFNGRCDGQLKVNGYRVEPAEIEVCLTRHQQIEQASVQLRETDVGSLLVAYIAPESNLNQKDLRDFLKQSLPDYMVPALFVSLDALPVNANGKLDVSSLPNPDFQAFQERYAEARDPLEARLVALWEDVLDQQTIGIHDDFFQLGGHSIKAARVVAQLPQLLNQEISLRDLFNHSNIAALADLIRTRHPSCFMPIQALEPAPHYALSHAQRRLWSLSCIDKNSAVYNMPGALRLQGQLDVNALEAALQWMIQRHESLRTGIIVVDDEPRQQIQEHCAFRVEHKDLRNQPESYAFQLAALDANTPFDLSKPPLMRAQLLRLPDHYLFLFNMHHIIGDGWSMEILVRELFTAYEAYLDGGTPDAAPLRIHYKAYAAWQNNLLAGDHFREESEYWSQILAGPLPVLELPTDRPRPMVQSFCGRTLHFQMDPKHSHALQTLSQRNRHSLFPTLVTLVKILLFHYTGERDLIVGAPTSGRNHLDLENLIGFFVNTLVLRDHLDPKEPFEHLLKRVCNTCEEAVSRQAYPFDQLLEGLDVKRDVSRSALFDVVVSLQNNEPVNYQMKGIHIEEAGFFMETSKFDMSFIFSEHPDGLVLDLEYNTDLFDESRMVRLWSHFNRLIASILENVKVPIGNCQLLQDEEYKALITGAEGPGIPAVPQRNVVELFQDSVRRTPHALAISGTNPLTFSELQELANRIAHCLIQEHGVGPEDRVALMFDTSPAMPAAIFGVLASGAAYVPLLPSYPEARSRNIIQRAACKVLLCDTPKNHFSLPVVDINTLKEAWAPLPPVAIHDQSLAYILFTSGSTGEPKGVMVSHGALRNLCLSLHQEVYSSSQEPLNLALLASYVFDASIQHLFAAPLFGHCLHLVDSETRSGGKRLLRFFRENRIQMADATPALLSLLIEALEEGDTAPDLVRLLVGGEALPRRMLERFFSIPGTSNVMITNVYGPTECCVEVLACHVDAHNLKENHEVISLGHSLPGSLVLPLTPSMEPSPFDIPGEIYISGPNLGRGYLDDPATTAKLFLPNPRGQGERMFRTHDGGVRRSAGDIHFLGRTDDLVKIRGFRVELGEVENVLLKHPDILEAVVLPFPAEDGETVLTAYFVCRNKTHQSPRDFLAQYLPDYMIPSFFANLDAMPLTSSGKLDKRALPQPENLMSFSQYKPPQNETERALVEIWKEVLACESVGIEDNFFDLGGHSLKAIRLASKVRSVLGVELLPADIFRVSRLTDQAGLIRARNTIEMTTIPKAPASAHYALSSAQKRLWVLDQSEKGSTAYHVQGGLVLDGDLDYERFREAVSILVTGQESLRTTFKIVNGEPRQIIHGHLEGIFQIRDYRHYQGEPEDLLRQMASIPFDLEKGPLFHLNLYRLPDHHGHVRHVLLTVLHHIICDGWSIDVLVRQLTALYVNPQPLPVSTSYKDYAAWQNQLVAGEWESRHGHYWRDKLGIDPPYLDLGLDFQRAETPVRRGADYRFEITPQQHALLLELGQQKEASLYMTLLSMVKILLYCRSGQSTIITGVEHVGRDQPVLDNQIGLFINMLALRDEIEGDMSLMEVLSSVRQTVLEAFAHKDYPFDRLVEDLITVRDRSRSPLFEVLVSLDNTATVDVAQHFSKIVDKAHALDFDSETCKYDLAFLFHESDQKLSARIQYDSSLFKAESIELMCGAFQKILTAGITDSNQLVNDLAQGLLGNEEKAAQELLLQMAYESLDEDF